MKLSIIMPVYLINAELGELTFNSWKSLENVEAERIMIDNGSPIKPNYDVDIMIKNKENLGYAPAVNQGIKLAHGEYLAIANNDIRVSPNWWGITKSILDEKVGVGSIHFRMLSYDTPMTFGHEVHRGGKERWCTSSFFVIAKDVFDNVGLYDEFYGKGSYDDYDLWHRVREKGYIQAYTNIACYQHKFSSTFKAVGQSVRDELDSNNYEHYKDKFGEYPDIQFANDFPEQMKEPYSPFP